MRMPRTLSHDRSVNPASTSMPFAFRPGVATFCLSPDAPSRPPCPDPLARWRTRQQLGRGGSAQHWLRRPVPSSQGRGTRSGEISDRPTVVDDQAAAASMLYFYFSYTKSSRSVGCLDTTQIEGFDAMIMYARPAARTARAAV